MEETKTIFFKHYRGINSTTIEEEFEFDIDATEQEIQQEFEDWVWNQIGDSFNWYEK